MNSFYRLLPHGSIVSLCLSALACGSAPPSTDTGESASKVSLPERGEPGDFSCEAVFPTEEDHPFIGSGRTGDEACANAKLLCDELQQRPGMCVTPRGPHNFGRPASDPTNTPLYPSFNEPLGSGQLGWRCTGEAKNPQNTYPSISAVGATKDAAIQKLLYTCHRLALDCESDPKVYCSPVVPDPRYLSP